MKEKLLSAIMALSAIAFAQPTFNYNSNHSIGNTSILYIIGGATTPLQQTGAAVTWDLSSNTVTQSGIFDIVDPATTPNGANYPSANTCFKQTVTGQGTTYTYMVDSTSILYSIATGIGGSNPTIWTQRDKLLSYPFNYMNSFSSVRQSSMGSPESFTRTYDAYGTLIVNGKTYNNVIRIAKNPGNAMWFTTSPVWFPIIIQINSTTFIYNEPTFVMGINGQSNTVVNMFIHPNPAQDKVKISTNGTINKVEVINLAGELQKTELNINEINISDLSQGMYFIKIYSNKGTAIQKIIKN